MPRRLTKRTCLLTILFFFVREWKHWLRGFYIVPAPIWYIITCFFGLCFKSLLLSFWWYFLKNTLLLMYLILYKNGDIISMISMYQLFEINALKSLTKEFQTIDRNLFLLISKKNPHHLTIYYRSKVPLNIWCLSHLLNTWIM